MCTHIAHMHATQKLKLFIILLYHLLKKKQLHNILTDLAPEDSGSGRNVSGTLLSYFCQLFCCRHLTPVLINKIIYHV